MSLTDSITAIQKIAREFPQVDFPTEHFFANGMYCRAIFMRAGTFAVGKQHKQEHFFMIMQGSIRIAVEDGYEVFTAPSIVVSQPGTKRALLVMEDAICVGIHRTWKTDLDEIEREVMEEDPLSMFNARNELKDPLLNERKKLEGPWSGQG